MARVTVEDCIDKVANRFELVLLAAKRAREISAGASITVPRNNDKNPVIALREISEETVSLEVIRESLVKNFQKIGFHEDLGDDFGKDFENEDIHLEKAPALFNDDSNDSDEDETDETDSEDQDEEADFDDLEEA